MLYFGIAIGIILGSILSNIYRMKKTAFGVLKIDTNDPDGPYLFLELSKEELDTIMHKDQVVLNVKNITQK